MNKEIKIDKEKFFYEKNGELSYLVYRKPHTNTIELVDTFVAENQRGQGIGSAIIRFALEYARKNDLKIMATCPAVKSFIAKNEEYRTQG